MNTLLPAVTQFFEAFLECLLYSNGVQLGLFSWRTAKNRKDPFREIMEPIESQKICTRYKTLIFNTRNAVTNLGTDFVSRCIPSTVSVSLRYHSDVYSISKSIEFVYVRNVFKFL
jgi:hypothetical protein